MRDIVPQFIHYVVSIAVTLGSFLLIQGCASTAIEPPEAKATPEFKKTSVEESRSSTERRYPQMDEGLRLEKEGRLEEALGIYRKVASEMPDLADVYARMAYTLRKMEYAKQSSEMFNKCEKIGGFKQDSPYAMDAKFIFGGLITNSVLVKEPTEERELLTTEAAAEALICSLDGYLQLVLTRPSDEIPIIRSTPTIGVGSELRFDRGDWVTFLGKQYRKGGVRIQKTGLEFLEGTEQLENGKVKVLVSGKFIEQ
ncbi:MAG TPA: hypothetical protein VMW14_01565 [Candidatus Paceibacterota bacterium]|nr:hypothetical protein [Candidatus Paceibacterota bacterium]